MRPKRTAYSGFAISLIGGSLDFVSGHQIATAMMPSASEMAYGLGLYALGVAVIVTGVMMVVPRKMSRMNIAAVLMEVYGVVMVLISSYAPSMQAWIGYAMLIVGILMFANAVAMQYSKKDARMKPGPMIEGQGKTA
jgi:hypothetical protein